MAFAQGSHTQVAPSDRESVGLAAEQAGQLRQALDDYIAALQGLPEPTPAEADRRLRERIIRVALKLDPPPATPAEVQQQITAGESASKSAQVPKEFQAAVSEFRSALRTAPWLGIGYFDLGELQEKMRDYPAAVRSFELYLLAVPSAKDADSIQKRITELRGRFPAMYLQTHSIFTQSALRPAWAMGSGGELSVSNSSIQFHEPGEPKHSFAFPVSELRALERRHGPEGFPVLRLKLQNGKKYDLVPDFSVGQSAAEPMKALYEAADAMEKAIREMASQHGITLQ